MTVEFDIAPPQLLKLGWEQGDIISFSGATWKIDSLVNDSRMDVVWVTLKKVAS